MLPVKYTFGTGETAAKRLEEMAKFFNPKASEWILKYNEHADLYGLDLGCGPGFTTDMLSKTIQSRSIYGLDKSDDFLRMARERFPEYEFIKHDITTTPFPVRTEVIYARFVLSHLRNAIDLINKWTQELEKNGLLFIEEVEEILTDNAIFRKYLNINEGLVASQGAELFVGKRLSKGNYHFKVICNESVEMPAANHVAASWFYPNTVSIWNDEPYVKEQISGKEKAKISQKLLEIKESKDENSDITWKMRRLVLKKE